MMVKNEILWGAVLFMKLFCSCRKNNNISRWRQRRQPQRGRHVCCTTTVTQWARILNFVQKPQRRRKKLSSLAAHYFYDKLAEKTYVIGWFSANFSTFKGSFWIEFPNCWIFFRIENSPGFAYTKGLNFLSPFRLCKYIFSVFYIHKPCSGVS